MEGNRVLVTGGLGFIGSNLVRELRRRGHEVWLCDLRHSEDPKSVRCDVSVFRQVERLFESQDFDYVYHAAAEYGRWNGEDYHENLWMSPPQNLEELRKIITDVIENPDEVYIDTFNTKYFLKKINEFYVNTIVVGESVKTAYLISKKSYQKFRERKWVRRLY